MRLIRRATARSEYVSPSLRKGHTAYRIEHVVCKRRAPVRRGDRGQGQDLEVGGAKAADHVSRVEATAIIRMKRGVGPDRIYPYIQVSTCTFLSSHPVIPCCVCQSLAISHVLAFATDLRDNVDLFPLRLLRNAFSQLGRPSLDAPTRRNSGHNNLDPIMRQRLSYPTPVLKSREKVSREPEFIEAQQAMREDDGVFLSI